jgi:RNA 3'-terminal phosphate cyclase (ATP)
MLTIDGSFGEGGGQIVRNAAALSALSGKPVQIERIRAGRTRPGLAAQHIAAVRVVAEACHAECSGLSPGSGSLTFIPGEPGYSDVSADVGTAGSISLVIQAWLPVALIFGGRLRVTGGTEVTQSPTIDYLDHVCAGVLRAAGAEIGISILKRGYYPEGGGEVLVGVKKKKISPIVPEDPSGSPCSVISCTSNLPDHVSERQATSAETYLREQGFPCTAAIDRRTGTSTGSSCTVWRGGKGGSALGKRGLPAEKVGKEAAMQAISGFNAPGTVDLHLSDQLLVPIALFGGIYTTAAATSHAATACRLIDRFGYTVRHERKGELVEYSA